MIVNITKTYGISHVGGAGDYPYSIYFMQLMSDSLLNSKNFKCFTFVLYIVCLFLGMFSHPEAVCVTPAY